MEKVFSIVRQTYGRSQTDDLNDLDVNTAFWSMFLTTIDWKQPMWKETTLSTDRAVQCATAETYVFLTQCCVWEASVMKQSKLRMLSKLLNMLEDTRKEKKWYGTHSTNRMENGIKMLKT